MGIIRNILLTVGLLWAVLFRVYPAVAGTVFSASSDPQTTVKHATHHAVSPSFDSAVYLVQDEDEQQVPTVHPAFLPALPVEWHHLLLAALLLLPFLMISVRKSAGHNQPYYLLYCSLRIPSV